MEKGCSKAEPKGSCSTNTNAAYQLPSPPELHLLPSLLLKERHFLTSPHALPSFHLLLLKNCIFLFSVSIVFFKGFVVLS